jgi:hypothetical protein
MRGVLVALALTSVASGPTGIAAGLAWRLGNGLAEESIVLLVVIAIPCNLVAAVGFYLATRGVVHLVDGGRLILLLIVTVNFAISLGIAVNIADVIGDAGGKAGAHLFTWGMSFAYGQAFKNVKHGAWFGE